MTHPGRDSKGLISGDRCIGPAELEARVARAAGGLAALGVRQGDFVAILLRNEPVFMVASLAAQRLGAYPVPLNWHFKGEEIGYILRDCGARVLVAHADLAAAVRDDIPAIVEVVEVVAPPEVRSGYPSAGMATGPGAREWESWLSASEPWRGPALPAPFSMIYTSGTTGHPKGVRRSPPDARQLAFLSTMREQIYGLKPGVRAMVPGPLYHSAPNAFAMRGVGVAEAFVLMPRFDPIAFLELVERYAIDTVFMVPTMFVRLMKLDPAVRGRYDVSSLRFIMHAAAPCPVDVKRAMIGWLGPIVWEFYGATELGAVTLISSAEWLRRPGSVGRPVAGARLSILDDDGRPVSQGDVGEVFSVLTDYPDFIYHNLPDKRREVDRDGLITCGDMGYVDAEGYLFICDRKRDMVISGGVNIYPAEIEAVAVTLAGVKDCAVLGVPDPEFGEALLALVEPQEGSALDAELVRTHLAAHLAAYKVPRRIEITHGLPREDSGKIFKRRLREGYWAAAGRRI